MYTVDFAFVALDVTLGQNLIFHSTCNKLADHLLEKKKNTNQKESFRNN